ncbi:MAG: AEC family transporter [Mycoplasmataceae bacterium]|nr:AEC family transporter [Mycoplasmataceae bacterium]
MTDAGLFFRIANVLVPIFGLILVGFIYARFYSGSLRITNELNMRIFVPALVFDALTHKSFDLSAYPWLIIAGTIVVIGSGLLSWPIARLSKQSIASFVPPMMFNNCGNMGLPVALLAFGELGLQLALVLFLVSNTLHFTLGVRIVSGHTRIMSVLFNAVNIAMVLGLIFSLYQLQIPAAIATPISMAAQVAIPLMLVSLGIRMSNFDGGLIKLGLLAGVVRPLVGVICALFAIWILPISAFESKLLILFAAMPPAVLNYLFADQYNRAPHAVASMVIVGNALSVFVLYIVLFLIL